MIAAVAFYLFATLTIASAVAVIFARNPVHSVLWLIVAFFNAAGLMLLLGAEFIAMLVVIVYVGAVAVLFLFVVMMLDVDFAELRQGFLNYLPVGAVVGLVVLVELLMVVGSWVIGAIVLTHRNRRDTRPQKVWRQVGRRPEEAIRNMDPGVGEGMKL